MPAPLYWDHRSPLRPVLHSADFCAVVYTFPSVHEGFHVQLAVPHDFWMRTAESVAVEAGNAGIRLQRQSRVQRVAVGRA